MNIVSSAKHYTARRMIDFFLNKFETDPDKALFTLIRFFEKLQIFDSWKFEKAMEMIQEEESKWRKLTLDVVDNTDEKILRTSLYNIAYLSAFEGTRIHRQLRKKLGTNIPWTILFDPTSSCNLHCKGCWAAEYGHQENLSFEEMKSIVEQGIELGIYFYLLTGGEPLVRKDDLIRLFRTYPDCAFHIFTNGTLIDEALCETIKEVGNVSFAVSIEGFKEANDKRRGEGCYEKICETLDLMKDHRLLYGASICYTQENYREVTSDEFVDFLISKGVRLLWYFHYMPVGKSACPELLLDPDAREYTLRRIREIRSQSSNKAVMTIDFQNDGQFIGGCIAGGKDYLHINAAGDVEPCVFIHYSSANIREVTIKEALAQPLFMAYKEHQPFNENHLRPCPMLENPQFLEQMVKETGAHSTDLMESESVTELCSKCRNYAQSWAPRADELWKEFGPLTEGLRKEENEIPRH